ncbi:MAG: hypothetical protein O7C59_05200 [Rickettsia endosymbiont of Ixodes persulcatus]|nr:hypothetical protein [Rickettsia endosymbiont of Ixodes persulcatus]
MPPLPEASAESLSLSLSLSWFSTTGTSFLKHSSFSMEKPTFKPTVEEIGESFETLLGKFCIREDIANKKKTQQTQKKFPSFGQKSRQHPPNFFLLQLTK